MLLRSSSTPLLNSFTPHAGKDSSPEAESVALLPRSRSISFAGSLSPADQRMTRALSESNLRDLALPKKTPNWPMASALGDLAVEEDAAEEEEEEEGGGFDIGYFGATILGSGLEALCDVGGAGVGGGRICGGSGGGSDGGDGGFGDGWGNDRGNESTDEYYRRMIDADPGNPLLLSNYAKYLKELRGDLVKAEEYCGRAILMKPDDSNTLSMYGDLIWQQHKDAARAETYFNQAIKASPDDCYVMASYAHFLWDAEEDEAEVVNEPVSLSLPGFFHSVSPAVPPIATAS